MPTGQYPKNEHEQLIATQLLHPVTTAQQNAYNDIARVAADICHSPIALIGLRQADRQWFKTTYGTMDAQISTQESVEFYTINGNGILLVADTLQDKRFAHIAFIKNACIRFYAGMPMLSETGVPLGILSVMDHIPRILTSDQVFALQALARQVQCLLSLDEKTAALKRAETLLAASQKITSNIVSENPPRLREMNAGMLWGKKILVADNNGINRLLAATILKNYGAVVTEAVSGQDAINVLTQTNIELVLMDVQMPVVDGMEAAEIIRQNISRQVPIIALTANQSTTGNEKYAAAGINAYLSKPFKEEDLVEITAFWLNKSSEAETEIITPAVDAGGLYSLSVIRSLSGGDEVFVEKMARMFIDQMPAQVITMEEKYLLADYKSMGSMAHSIKPVIDNMSIQSLKELIREVEKKGKEEVSDISLKEVISRIKNTIHLVAADLENKYPE